MTKLEVIEDCYNCSGCFYKSNHEFGMNDFPRCKKYDYYCTTAWQHGCGYGKNWRPSSKFYTDEAIIKWKLKLKRAGFIYRFTKFIATMFETETKTEGEKTDEI